MIGALGSIMAPVSVNINKGNNSKPVLKVINRLRENKLVLLASTVKGKQMKNGKTEV